MKLGKLAGAALVCFALACGSDDGGSGSGGTSSGSGSAGTTSGSAGASGTGGTSGTSGTGGSSGAAGSAGGSGSSGTGGSAGAAGTGSVVAGACDNADGQLFPPDAPFNQSVESAPLASDSQAIIDYLQANHMTGARFQVDFSITVLEADASTPKESFEPSDDFYEPDCDPAPVPIVAGGAIEGEDGYACESDGDCHLLVHAKSECRLYEMWRANRTGAGAFSGGCLAVWDTDRVYPATGRGDFCTSADAGGLPIAPLLFSADEIAAGEIKHAIRFILPNDRIRELRFVRPGTHSTRSTSGPAQAPPYAARLRLKADADLSELNEAAQVVARALQRYGMILADAGNLTFTAKSDRFDEHSWDEVGFGPGDLKALSWSDFEVVDGGTPIDWESGSCERSQVTE